MRSKVAALFVAVFVALAVLGLGYAWWTETLTINGTLTTGKLEVKFVDGVTKSCSSYIECTATVSDTSISVTVVNAYPCGWCNITFTINNTGTIPAKVKAINISPSPALSVSIDGLSVGTIILPNQTVSPVLKIHATEAADETTTYTFTVTIEFGQFNAP